MNLHAVQVCTASLLSGKEFFKDRVIDNAESNLSLRLVCNGGAEERVAVGVVCRAVEGVDDPFIVFTVETVQLFLADDIVFREPFPYEFYDSFLTGNVYIRYEVNIPFMVNIKGFLIVFTLYLA